MNIRKTAVLGAVLASTGLLTSACLGGDGGGGDGEADGKVQIVGNPSGAHAEALQKDLAAISEETGIEIEYIPLSNFDTVVGSRVAGGNVPDLAIFPQPGLLLNFAADGDILPLDEIVDVPSLTPDVIPGVLDTVTGQDGTVFGLPYSINVKSLVWYPKAAFEAGGYEIPTTQGELEALMADIKADGTAPWCFGVDVGWPGTDWLEEYVLRIGGPEVYDQWVHHEIPFNDPVIIEAGKKVEEMLLTEGNVYGGTAGITANTFDTADDGLWTDPPSCMLHRQANFITGFFPEDVQADLTGNVGLFLLPAVEDGWDGGQPVLGGGDFLGAFKNDADVKTVLEAILTTDFGANLAKTGEWISPLATYDTSAYPNELLAAQAELAANADAYRFDGSDQMPGQIGNGVFWTGMVEWMGGQKDLNTVLDEIEAEWASIE